MEVVRTRGLVASCLPVAALAIAGFLSLVACHRPEPENETYTATPEIALAAGAVEDARFRNIDGASVERGMKVVVGTHECRNTAGCFSCYQCHGIRGEGSAVAIIPRLAGQSYVYLHQSLQDFASGERENSTMQSVAQTLTPRQMQDVSAYYAAIRPTVLLDAVSAGSSVELVTAGRQIALEGSVEPAVQACASCHGGQGREPAAPIYPYIASQHVNYLERQLHAFRAGVRRDPLQIMQFIADQLTEEQIRAVSYYYGSLQYQELTWAQGSARSEQRSPADELASTAAPRER